jgi:pimeloyl-ACP methyl ester carboxylesterase
MTQSLPHPVQYSKSPGRICYVEGGTSDLPPAIFAHGWIGNRKLYEKCYSDLGKILHFYAIDWPGFGDSDKPSPSVAPYNPPFFASEVIRFADEMGLKKFILVGQSMGGIAATECAIRHPDRIEKLILVDSAGIPVPPPILGSILTLPVVGKPLFMALGTTKKALTDFVKNDVYHVKSDTLDETVTNMQRIMRTEGAKEAAYACLIHMVSVAAMKQFAPRFAEVKVPTRLIWGSHDKLFPVEPCARTVEKSIAGAVLEVLDDCGHEPPFERPELFMAALRRALA